MKRTLLYSLFAMLVVFGSCLSAGAASQLRVGLIVQTTGLGDKGFCDSAYEGLLRAIEELGIEGKVIEPKTESEYIEQYRALTMEGYDLVIGLTSAVAEEVRELADEFPETKYGIIDYSPTTVHPQIAGVNFVEHHGSFLAGALAGMMTKTNKLGYVGGVDTPLLRRFQMGYIEGAKYVNPDVEVISVVVGGFGDPTKGKELALSLFERGVDIVYHAAGKSGDGVIAAAKEQGKYVIGVNTNQDYMAPGTVLTSMVKRVDNAVFKLISDTVNGEFKGGMQTYGLPEGGVSLTNFEYTRDLIPDSVFAKLDEIEQDLIAGKIQVEDPVSK